VLVIESAIFAVETLKLLYDVATAGFNLDKYVVAMLEILPVCTS